MGLEEDWLLLLPCTFVHCRMMASLHPCWIGTGGVEADPPDTNFQSPVWGSSSTSVGGLNPPNPPTNRTLTPPLFQIELEKVGGSIRTCCAVRVPKTLDYLTVNLNPLCSAPYDHKSQCTSVPDRQTAGRTNIIAIARRFVL